MRRSIVVIANRLHVLKFFVSARLVALRTGVSIQTQRDTVEQMIGDIDYEHMGLAAPISEHISTLFARGFELMDAEKAVDRNDPQAYERWLQQVESIEPSEVRHE